MFKLFLCSICIFVLVSCAARAQETSSIQAEQNFAVHLYSDFAATPGNFVVSPYGVLNLLLMAYVGSKGQTKIEMMNVLHLQGINISDEEKNVKVRWPVNPNGTTFQSHFAYSVWVSGKYTVKQNFDALITQDFGAGLQYVDFSRREKLTSYINNWFAGHGDSNALGPISADFLTEQTGLFLTNSAYLDAEWEFVFDPKYDRPVIFHVAPGHVELMNMMTQNWTYRLTQTPDADVIALDYIFGLSMVIILPHDDTGLPGLEAKLNVEILNKWLEEGRSTSVSLVLPRFKEMSHFDLKKPLQDIGIKLAFDAVRANLTGIAEAPAKKLYVNGILEYSSVNLGDGGTSDGVHSGECIGCDSFQPSSPIVPFVVDHPFIYLIRDNRTGAILFIGRVVNPSQH